MFLFELLFVSIIHLAMIGLDLISFFLVIRVLTFRWPARPLLALDRIGEPVIDPLLATVGRTVPSDWTNGKVRLRHLDAAVTLLVLALCRLVLAGLVS